MWIKRIILGFALALACSLAAAGAYEDMVAAVKQNQTDVVAGLLKRGLDVDTSDQEGTTLLMLAIKEGSTGATKQLLDARAKVNTRNQFGESALMLAAIKGDVD
ncbi:MAG: ankyrin repeat domain-containing protein, partial [Burkholderiales bacterium]